MPHSLHFLTHTVFIATLCMYEMVAENNATFYVRFKGVHLR